MKPNEIEDSTRPGALLAAFEAGVKSAAPVEVFPGLIAHHKDYALADKAAQRLAEAKQNSPGPYNAYGTLVLLTPESFSCALLDYRDCRSKVFANNVNGEITAVFDYVTPGGAITKPLMGWGQHRATITFAESRKLMEWKKTLEWMGQVDFANFLEDHLEDVISPSGQELLGIATDLEASSTGGLKSRVNLDNGSVRLNYQDDVETSVEIPRNLVLGIPLFEHGDRYKLGARLRFVISGGHVKFKLLFTNLQDSKEAEFERITQEIEAKTATVIYRGRLVILSSW